MRHGTGWSARRVRVGGHGRNAVRVALALIVALLMGWAGLRWSMITMDVHDRVVDVYPAEEGPTFRVLVLARGDLLTVDDELVRRLEGDGPLPGEQVVTRRWSRTLSVGGQTVSLRLASRSWWLLGLVAGLALVGLRRSWGGHRDPERPVPD
jgi:hypothetical protein